MSDTLAALAQSLRNDNETMRLVALNVANTQTTGYRRSVAVQHASFSVPAATEPARGLADLAPVPSVTQVHDAKSGALRPTGRSLDFALSGDGYFVVQRNGESLLTRRGDFHLDAVGQLVTANGDLVQGERGAIVLSGEIAEVTAEGNVQQAGVVLDRLLLRQVADPGQLQAAGADCWRATSVADAAGSATRPNVNQGYLESSNVDAVTEMVRVIETMRHFEATQRFVRGYDDLVQKGIGELGKV